MKKLFIILAVIIVAALSVWYFAFREAASSDGQFSFVEVTRGDLENLVSCTGTLSAVGTVEIGTQVSGSIDSVFVDFNDTVKKGQLLAVLDTTLLAAAVRDAEAGVLRATAQMELAESEFKRDIQLYDKDLISEQAFIASQTNSKTAQASLTTSKASLDRARTNLKYAVIRSPIDGTVIHRNVEPGQTVAASFSTPTLYIIAEDLARMEIHAQVDESDIGQIKNGQEVRFTVQTYIDETFAGTVRQIWLQPTTVQNVVTYTVVIDANNRDNLLLPGMTATVDFILEQKQDVLLIPNAALRFTPTEEMMQEMRAQREQRTGEQPDSTGQKRQRPPGDHSQMMGGMGRGGPSQHGSGGRQNFAMLWYLDEDGQVQVSRALTGTTDGKMTEIVRSRNIEEGMKIISGNKQVKSSSTSSQQSGPPHGRRMF